MQYELALRRDARICRQRASAVMKGRANKRKVRVASLRLMK